jgi:hypothetical protein
MHQQPHARMLVGVTSTQWGHSFFEYSLGSQLLSFAYDTARGHTFVVFRLTMIRKLSV